MRKGLACCLAFSLSLSPPFPPLPLISCDFHTLSPLLSPLLLLLLLLLLLFLHPSTSPRPRRKRKGTLHWYIVLHAPLSLPHLCFCRHVGHGVSPPPPPALDLFVFGNGNVVTIWYLVIRVHPYKHDNFFYNLVLVYRTYIPLFLDASPKKRVVCFIASTIAYAHISLSLS